MSGTLWLTTSENSESERLPGDRGMGAAPARRASAIAKINLTKAIIVFGLEKSGKDSDVLFKGE